MKNSFINRFKNTIELNIKGKNIERFLRRLIKQKIELINIEYIKYNEIIIKIYKNDYKKVLDLKTIYEIDLIKYHGLIKIKQLINKNKYILISFFICLIFIFILSNTIFDVEVIHSDKNFRNFLKVELEEKGIKKYNFVKSYKEIQNIKKDLLSEYKDKIDWLEIERKGTKYIIRVEERITTKEQELSKNRNVVAKKSGIIKKVIAKKGEIIKNTNDYVNKGDIVISGNLYLNDNLKNTISADGVIYGEVWYSVTIEYPLNYKEIKKTGNKKTIYTFKFLNKYYNLFNIKNYKTKIIKNEIIFKNNLIPFSFIKQKQYETIEIDKKYNKKNVVDKALKEASKKIKLKSDEKILNYKILNKDINDERVILEIFFSVYENITDYSEITEKIEDN